VLRTRSTNDLSLKEDRVRYNKYLLSLFFVRIVLSIEIGEFSHRKSSKKEFKKYLEVRSFKSTEDITRDASGYGEPIILSEMDDSVPTDASGSGADNVELEEGEIGDDTVTDRVLRGMIMDEAVIKNDSIKMASFNLIGETILEVNKKMGACMLANHFDEGFMERQFKALKRFMRDSDFKTLQNDFQLIVQNQDEKNQVNTAHRDAGRWEGAGISFLLIGVCWIERLPLAGLNLMECFQRVQGTEIDIEHFVKLRFSEDDKLDRVSIQVGEDVEGNNPLWLCACGNPDHIKVPTSARPLNAGTWPFLAKFKVNIPFPAVPDLSSDVNDFVGDIKIKREKKTAAAQLVYKTNVVYDLLVGLGFPMNGKPAPRSILADELDEFRKMQPRAVLTGPPYPSGKLQRLEWIFEHRDRNFEVYRFQDEYPEERRQERRFRRR
jgi:hypothetical protein